MTKTFIGIDLDCGIHHKQFASSQEALEYIHSLRFKIAPEEWLITIVWGSGAGLGGSWYPSNNQPLEESYTEDVISLHELQTTNYHRN